MVCVMRPIVLGVLMLGVCLATFVSLLFVLV
jgi:hypothetical protein